MDTAYVLSQPEYLGLQAQDNGVNEKARPEPRVASVVLLPWCFVRWDKERTRGASDVLLH